MQPESDDRTAYLMEYTDNNAISRYITDTAGQKSAAGAQRGAPDDHVGRFRSGRKRNPGRFPRRHGDLTVCGT